MANGNWRIPLSSRLSWWIKLYRLRRHNIQRSFWLIPPHLPLPRRRANWSKNLRADQDLDPTPTDLAFSVAPSGTTTVTYAQLQARLVAVVTKLITLQASVNRLPKTTESPNLPPINLLHRIPDGDTWDWWNKKSTPTPFPRKAYNMRTSSLSQAGNPLTLASLQRRHPLTKAISSCFFWTNQTQTAECKFLFK